jgi:hypothetical protein
MLSICSSICSLAHHEAAAFNEDHVLQGAIDEPLYFGIDLFVFLRVRAGRDQKAGDYYYDRFFHDRPQPAATYFCTGKGLSVLMTQRKPMPETDL